MFNNQSDSLERLSLKRGRPLWAEGTMSVEALFKSEAFRGCSHVSKESNEEREKRSNA